MSSLRDSDAVIRRLKGMGLVAPGTGAVLSRKGHSRCGPGSTVLWEARDVLSGEPLGIASRFGVRLLAASARWRLVKDDGVTFIEPGT